MVRRGKGDEGGLCGGETEGMEWKVEGGIVEQRGCVYEEKGERFAARVGGLLVAEWRCSVVKGKWLQQCC